MCNDKTLLVRFFFLGHVYHNIIIWYPCAIAIVIESYDRGSITRFSRALREKLISQKQSENDSSIPKEVQTVDYLLIFDQFNDSSKLPAPIPCTRM